MNAIHSRWVIGAGLVLLSSLLGPVAQAQSASALWLQLESDPAPVAALLLDTAVEIDVVGPLAYATVSQRFVNRGGQWAEGRYVFPLPDGSAVESLLIRIGDRLIEGEIQERSQAAASYREARDSGRRAGLVEQHGGQLFSTTLANIAPGETVEVRVGFRLIVDHAHGRYSLRFPNALMPAGPGAGGDRTDTLVAGDQQRWPDARAGAQPRRFSLDLSLTAGVELAALESSFHAISSVYRDGSWQVSLDEEPAGDGRDFELSWRPARPEQVQLAAFRQRLGGQDHALLMLIPPQRRSTQRVPRELILILDTSGSMSGEPMEQARAAMHQALDSLGGGDRFNLIEFNHQTRALHPASVAASNARVAEARRFVDGLRAGGGTVMGPSLRLAMRDPVPDGYLRQVVFVTDGIIGNEAEVLDQIAEEIGEARLFTVGIGHGVNSQFLRHAARLGRGSLTLIGDTGQVFPRMSELIAELTQPALTDIELHWPSAVQSWPEQVPDLYLGQPLIVAVRADRLEGELLVHGRNGAEIWQQVVPLSAFQEGEGIAAHWARQALAGMQADRRQRSDADWLREQGLALALEYQLLSPWTSLVAVDRTPVRRRDEGLAREAVPGQWPHGRSMAAAAARSPGWSWPATDAGSEFSLIRGLLALLLVALLLGQKRIQRDEDGEPS